MTVDQPEDPVAAVRRFNRFYTSRIGVLSERPYGSEWSLTEARVLYELARRERPTAGDLSRELGVDAGYLSRILRRFEERGLLTRTPAPDDARVQHLTLTARGRRAFSPLDRRSHERATELLRPLPEREQTELVDAMRRIERALGGESDSGEIAIRTHRPGDLGWLLERHTELYVGEFGWHQKCEGLFAEIVANFARAHDPRREHCWIAERRGQRLGSVMLVDAGDRIGKLRMLLVEPSARGLGLGERLVAECERFARAAGYRRITLWTQSVLIAARAMYAKRGYRLVESKSHDLVGPELVGETWELELST
jgi:DNA-binding MarR family transcriptional regulator/N-acetylglutamate synthase-like GNAT family acetyltransferase